MFLGEGVPQGNYVASGYSVYEEENERLQEGLRDKVHALKHVSYVDNVFVVDNWSVKDNTQNKYVFFFPDGLSFTHSTVNQLQAPFTNETPKISHAHLPTSF